MLKATNDVFERHHGISPLDGVLKGLNEARKKVARAIAPNSKGPAKKQTEWREQKEEVYGEREEARKEVNRKARVGNRREKREREQDS